MGSSITFCGQKEKEKMVSSRKKGGGKKIYLTMEKGDAHAWAPK